MLPNLYLRKLYVLEVLLLLLLGGVPLFSLATTTGMNKKATELRLKVGIDAYYPPFSEKNEAGEYVGFDVEIAQAICAELDAECEYHFLPWDEVANELRQNRLDIMVASVNNTPDMLEKFTLTEKYYQILAKMIRLRGSRVEYSARAIMGKKIGVIQGTAYERHVMRLFNKAADIERYDIKNRDQMFNDLRSKKIDIIFADAFSLYGRKSNSNFEFFGPDLVDSIYYGSGAKIAVQKGNQTLADKISKAILATRKHGSYMEISEKYFGADIYGY